MNQKTIPATSRNAVLQTAREWLIDTLFPRCCVGCGASDTDLCASCQQLIVPFTQQQCVRCHAMQALGRTCPKCRSKTALYQVLSAVHFSDGPVREALHWIKYHGRGELLQQFAGYVNEHAQIQAVLSENALNPNLLIVPVPLHRRRQFWRGFNQSELIATAIAKKYHRHITKSALRRRLFSHSQIGLPKLRRAENVHDAFDVSDGGLVKGKTVILVDDIVTTGATLSACAYVLKKAGAKRVIAIVLARAV